MSLYSRLFVSGILELKEFEQFDAADGIPPLIKVFDKISFAISHQWQGAVSH